jgi:hypothetical protein
MSAPPQGFGSGGGLSPTTFLGTYSGSNPSSPANGYWWYRVDLGEIWANVNGTIMPIQNTGAVTIISSNTTIANTDVYNDIIVTNNATLTIYGNVTFHGNVIIENGSTLLSSNPNASSSSTQTNNYQFLGNFYLNGTYEIAEYNTDNILNSITLTTINSSGGANPTISGSGTLNIGSNITLTISENVTVTIPTLSGSGTISVSSGYTLTINTNITLSISNMSGAGTLVFSSGYTVSIPSVVTLNINVTMNASLSGSGTINIGSGYTFTLNINYTISSSSIQFSGSGTISVGSGYTLTISNNVTWTLNLAGSGTLSVSSGYTLTQGASISLAISTISVAGTWANAGYGITIPSGATVSWTTTGSLTTGSSAGTLTIDGTLYYYGISLSDSTTGDAGIPSFPLNLTGSGIGMFAANGSASGGNTISLNNTSIPAGSNDGSASASTDFHITLTAIKGSAVGKYGIEIYNSSTTDYYQVTLIYIGTANTTYNVNFTAATSWDIGGGTNYVRNSSSSAGTITLTGTAYT